MARPHKSAHNITGNDFSQSQLNKLKEIEDALHGSNKDLINVSDKLSDATKYYYLKLLSQINTNILSDLDKPIIEQCAFNLVKIDECHKSIDDSGLVVNGKANPHVAILKNLEISYNKQSSLLGLSPNDRASFSRSLESDIKSQNVELTEYDRMMIEMNELNKDNN